MTSKRTLTKIIEAIERGNSYKARISGYYYNIFYNEDRDVVEAVPVGSGNTADSDVEYSDINYRNGGNIFKEAVVLAKDIHELLRSRSAGDYRKEMVDMEFEDINGKTETHRVEIDKLGNIDVYKCPMCDRLTLIGRGCVSGHIAITPKIQE